MKVALATCLAAVIGLGQATQVPLIIDESPGSSTRASEVLSLHEKLIKFESITGQEAGVGRWLKSYLEGKNFTVELQEVSQNRYNVLAYPGVKNTRVLVSSHIDTVSRLIASIYCTYFYFYFIFHFHFHLSTSKVERWANAESLEAILVKCFIESSSPWQSTSKPP